MAERNRTLYNAIDTLGEINRTIAGPLAIQISKRSKRGKPHKIWRLNAIGKLLVKCEQAGDPISPELLSRITDQQARVLLHMKSGLSFFHIASIYNFNIVFGNLNADYYRMLTEDPNIIYGGGTDGFLQLDLELSRYSGREWDEVGERLEGFDRDQLLDKINLLRHKVEKKYGVMKSVRSLFAVGMMIEDLYVFANNTSPPEGIMLAGRHVASDIQLGGKGGLLEIICPTHPLVLQPSI